MNNKPHWLTKEEIESQFSICELVFGVCGLNGKWYFSNVELEGVHGPYDTYQECVEACCEYIINIPHWLTEQEMRKLPEDSKLYCDATTFLKGKWYFYNETYSQLNGPYQTRKAAQEAQEKYEDTI